MIQIFQLNTFLNESQSSSRFIFHERKSRKNESSFPKILPVFFEVFRFARNRRNLLLMENIFLGFSTICLVSWKSLGIFQIWTNIRKNELLEFDCNACKACFTNYIINTFINCRLLKKFNRSPTDWQPITVFHIIEKTGIFYLKQKLKN